MDLPVSIDITFLLETLDIYFDVKEKRIKVKCAIRWKIEKKC